MRQLLGLWRTLLVVASFGLLAGAPAARAADAALQAVPALSGRVIDQTATLSDAQRAALDAKLAAFEAQSGPQIVVVMVADTAPEDLVDFTQRLGDAWKIGRRDVGDGLLIVVAKNTHDIRIAPAKALEGAIPDLIARRIIDEDMAPAFRQDDYAGGFNRAIDAVEARLRGEPLPPPVRQTHRVGASDDGGWQGIATLFFVGVPVLGALLTAVFGRKLGSVVTAGGVGALAWLVSASVLAGVGAGLAALVLVGVLGVGSARRGGLPIVWGGGGFGGGGGGGGFGGGGGGFGSGGGGDFGGGGASGKW
ncbi:MAG: TPM domain-containing protein [Pelomonas sp.]|nr:TPM domain-containing protein [Roseateles sp.]